MREDLPEIVRMAKEAGFDQIQLNTTGIKLGFDPELMVRLRHEGVNTLYMSFDGVSKRANPKNHWEIPLTLKRRKEGGDRDSAGPDCDKGRRTTTSSAR